MYILKRILSAYTAPDILLGIYRTVEDAREARRAYISSYHDGRREDPWEKQGYHKVALEEDVVILDTIPEFDIPPDAGKVMVISSYSEGFGQVVRKIHALCGSEKAARGATDEARKEFIGGFPEAIEIETIEIGKALSDDKKLNTRPHV